jgi:hypothetical protein
MAENADWRHGRAYDYVDRLDPAGLAWEFLRRNRRYRDDYEGIPKHKRDTASDTLTSIWGLRFPGFPDPSRHRCGCLFRAALRPWDAPPDSTPAGPFTR